MPDIRNPATLTLYDLDRFAEGQRILGGRHALATGELAGALGASELLLGRRPKRWILLQL